jgi:hypothetical protein
MCQLAYYGFMHFLQEFGVIELERNGKLTA